MPTQVQQAQQAHSGQTIALMRHHTRLLGHHMVPCVPSLAMATQGNGRSQHREVHKTQTQFGVGQHGLVGAANAP